MKGKAKFRVGSASWGKIYPRKGSGKRSIFTVVLTNAVRK
jgi:hypothetical protein